MRELTVLYDAACPICRAARNWLERRGKFVPMVFVPAGSDEARLMFPGLDHAATLRDLTVVADSGEVYGGDSGWLICLWALRSHRGLALRLAQPHLRPYARQLVKAASAVRRRTRDPWADDACELTEVPSDLR